MGYTYLIPSSSASIIPILIITCSLLIPIAFSMEEDSEVHYGCVYSNKPFNGNYSQIRELVVIDLIVNTASSDGFMNISFASADPAERAYGLALCRGDVSPDDCTACVNNSAIALIDADHCPDNRSAIIWRDLCFFKYSDDDFFGNIDTNNEFPLLSNESYMVNSKDAFRNFMGNLSQFAIQSPNFYFEGTSYIMAYDDCEGCYPGYDCNDCNPNSVVNVTLYVVAQCTRDLSADDCKACLDHAASYLTARVQVPVGARILYGSCNIRYDNNNFLNN